MSDTNPTPPGMHRRGFYQTVIYALNALMGAALAVPTLIYLLVPPKGRKPSAYVDAGDVSQLTVGVPVEMSFQQSRVDGWRAITEKKTAWVVKNADNSVVAYGPQCTHLGCAYHYEESTKKFICPCHTSYFSIQGAVLSGPAPRALDRYQTRIENNRLMVGVLKPSDGSQA